MGVVAVKCPNCGAQLDVDESREFSYCTYCGSQIRVQNEKIRVEISGKVKVDESDKYGNLKTLATRAFDANNMSEAYNYYTKALEIRQDEYLPVFRKALCAGYLSDDLGLRIEEVVSGVSIAFDMVSDEETKKKMSSEIITFALTDKLEEEEKEFKSEKKCELYAECVHDRVVLLDRLYPFLNKEDEDGVRKYIDVTTGYCRRVMKGSIKYIAGIRVKDGKEQNVYRNYPIPNAILTEVTAVNKHMAEDYNKYLQPEIDRVTEEIASFKEQVAKLPAFLKISHIISQWWILVIGLFFAFVLLSYSTTAGLIVGLVILLGWLGMLISFHVVDKDKAAKTLYQNQKLKKKELSKLRSQLKS